MNSLDNKKIVLNPGSVGQPRDGDYLAKWAIIDTKTKKIIFMIIELKK